MIEISTYNSKKIAILNAVAIVLVLLLHSYFLEAAEYSIAYNVQLFTGTNGISGVAVPLFYFISGILFYKSINHIKDCVLGIRKRFKTLLVPYVIWNVVFVGWYLFLSIIPGVSGFVNSDILNHFSLNKPIASLSYLLIEPAGFHLWFLRDLISYILMTPLIYIVCKRFPIIAFCMILIIFGWINRCGVTYFTAGAIVSIHLGLDFFEKGVFKNKGFRLFLLLLFLSKCIMTVLPTCNSILYNPYFQQIANLAGILAIWKIYDKVLVENSRMSNVLLFVSKYSFFIYLFHEPVFNIIKKLSLWIIGRSEGALIALYFVNPILMMAFAIGVAWIMKKYIPIVYSITTGGR